MTDDGRVPDNVVLLKPRPMRRYERTDSVRGLMRTLVLLTAGGLLVALLWQLVAPLGQITLRPDGPRPDDSPLATSDSLFTLLSGGWGLLAGAGLQASFRRHPERVRRVKETTWYWASWFVVGLLGVVTGVLLAAAAERLLGSAHPFELSTWVPLLAWPMAFNLVVCVGSLFGSRRSARPLPNPAA